MAELTEYEQQRRPHNLTSMPHIEFSKTLQREFMCPICLDILKDTRATKDCLHRFCHDCINKALRSGNKECPTCRKKLASMRCLRPDSRFDALIEMVLLKCPELSRTVKMNRETNFQELKCDVVLRSLHGAESSDETRYIKCPPCATIGHIARYLVLRPNITSVPNDDSNHEYCLAICHNQSNGYYQRLDNKMKLEEFYDGRPLELYFIKK